MKTKAQLVAQCDSIIRYANSHKQNMSTFKGVPVSYDYRTGKVTLTNPSANPLALAQKLYYAFLADYVQAIRTYLNDACENDGQLPTIEAYLALCQDSCSLADLKRISSHHMSVPLPEVAPYKFLEGTSWSYGDVLGSVGLLVRNL